MGKKKTTTNTKTKTKNWISIRDRKKPEETFARLTINTILGQLTSGKKKQRNEQANKQS